MQSSFPQSNTPQIRRAGVDLNGVMSVLSKHLYSTPTVALRELVQNAHDSILRRRLEQPDWQGPSRIEVIGDSASNTVRIVDTGAGLTEHEIHAYLATVGVGYTRGLRQSGHEDSGLIGMFGLGFLSAFVLARRVSVRTTSYQQPELGFCYVSSNAEQYSVTPMPARPVGTEITLELQDEYSALTQAARLREILERYCVLLREPIHVGGDAQPINPEPPPWRLAADAALHPLQRQRRDLEFAARFEHDFEPICCLPVRPDERVDVQGLLWIQDGGTYGTSDNRNLSVFLRGMLLDDDARDLLPSWAGFVGGVIESNRLTPTASREDLQRDDHYAAIQHALAEALIAGLGEVARQQPEAWRRVLLRHNEALLGAALCDERLFALMMDSLRVPTSQGDLPASELLARSGACAAGQRQRLRGNAVPCHGRTGGPWQSLCGGTLPPSLGAGQGDAPGGAGHRAGQPPVVPPRPTARARDRLAGRTPGRRRGQLVIARFSPEELPLVVVPDRDAELKRRLEDDEADKRISTAALRLARQFTRKLDNRQPSRLYVNLDNPAVQALLAAVGEERDEAAHAALLLRSFKVIIAGQGRGQPATSLNQALAGLADSVKRLLGQ